jgi:hemerythrin-like metal-binding protein
MALFRWRESLALGIAEIDSDHKQMISTLNRFHFVDRAGADRSAVGAVMDELIAFAQSHFDREEALMQRCRYPGIEAHCAQHRQMCADLAAFQAEFQSDPQHFNGQGFYDFVADWMIVHMLSEDLKLKPYVVELTAHQAA